MNKLGKTFRPLLYFSVFLIVLISNTAYCYEPAKFNQAQQEAEKVYVNPEQIEITKEAIIIWSQDGKHYILTDSVAFDELGVYIKQPLLQRGPCGLHTRWCKRCGGCGVLLCPMNCTCFD